MTGNWHYIDVNYERAQQKTDTKLILQMDAVLVPAGMPSMPGMEDMMKKQMQTGLDSTMQSSKKLIEA